MALKHRFRLADIETYQEVDFKKEGFYWIF